MTTLNRPLGSLLFGAYRRQALGVLLMNPDRQFHVRELSRLTKTSPGTMHKELAMLAAAGVLNRQSRGNQALYSANTACPVFEDLRNILRKTSGVADVIRDALAPYEKEIASAFAFGSVARGEEGPTSDVDVAVVGKVSYLEVVEALQGVQEEIGREINPIVYSIGEFRSKALEQDSFVQRLLGEKKIFLKGDVNDLGKLVEDQAAARPHPHRSRDSKVVQSRRTPARRRKV